MTALHRLTLRHSRGRSAILVGERALEAAAEEVERWCAGRRVFVVASSPIEQLYGDRIRQLCRSSSALEWLEVPDGERAKQPAVAVDLWRQMMVRGGKRDSRVLALGGGSVGDLAGFVSSCFMRGIEFSQVPTTLLAQVDAAIGGKTAIDLPEGKNTVGAFHHPALVIADTSVLESLPVAEFRSGLVEIIKIAALLDPDLFRRVEERIEELAAGHCENLPEIVAAAIAVKIRVVEADPEEAGDRRLLNFGHTLGHAIEKVLDYRVLRHGEAVAYGLLFATRLARRRQLGDGLGKRLEAMIDRLSLPALPRLDPDALIEAMQRDKKVREDGLDWVLGERLGRGRLEGGIEWGEVRSELDAFLDGLEGWQ